MIIATTPDQYQPAFKELIYTIQNADPTQNVEVEIRDNTLQSTIAIKRFTGQTAYHVNIAPYVQQQFDVEPIISPTCHFSIASGRVMAGAIAINGVGESPKRLFTAASCLTPIHTKLSGAPNIKKIARNQTDEIAIIAPQATISATVTVTDQNQVQTKINISPVFAAEGVYVLVVAMGDIEQRVTQLGVAFEQVVEMSVVVAVDAVPKITQKYIVEQPESSSVRIAWVNQHGSIDYYSCSHVEQTMAEKQGHTAKITRKIVSQYENYQTMLWLAQIVAAPSVWEITQAGAIPISIECQMVVIHSEELARLEVTTSSQF